MPFLALAGSLVGAAGSVMGGISAQNQANYQAKIAERNAQVAGMMGATALQAGYERATETSLAGAERLAKVKTGMAAGGVDINRGSAVNVRASQRMANALSTATGMWNASRANWGYGQQAIGYEAQAEADRAAGRSALVGGILSGVGGALGGLSSIPGLGGMFGGGSTAAAATGGGGVSGGGFLGGASPTGSNSALASSPNIFDWKTPEFGGGADNSVYQW